jgi:sugar/nucleoside kinase (ribokinase family)
MQQELTKSTSAKLAAAADTVKAKRAMIGVDAFVDEIIRIVDRRTSPTEFTTVPRISDLAAKIAAASGLGTNMELIVDRIKLGGNGPIMANALAAHGMGVTNVGPFGENGIHPAFAEIAARATVISLGEPAHTDALEFDDGKLMLGKQAMLRDITWSRMVERIGQEALERYLTESDLVGLVNWTMIPAMDEIWHSALALLETRKASGRFFFDLADPERHTDSKVAAGCELLSRFQKHGPTTLGLNEKEAFRIGEALGFTGQQSHREHVRDVAKHISAALKIDSVVVHPRAYAVSASQGEITGDVDGPFIDEPLISTGAGDHFNAGFCLGKLVGFSDEEALTVAVGNSGYYVRTAVSPSVEQLAEFLAEQGR